MNKVAEQSTAKGYRFVTSEQVSTLVNDEMEKDSFFHPNLGGITKGGMSNHYPMTIMSLSGLGASDNEISRFRQLWPRYRSHIETDLGLIDNNEITLDNWQDYLGKASRLLEFRRVFLQGLLTPGKKNFITDALEKMKLSLPMGLFHPLIQLSFAVIHGDNKLIANALAYFAIRYKNLYRQYPELPLASDNNISATAVWANIHQNINTLTIGFQPRGGSLRICEQLCAENNMPQLTFANGFVINEDNLTKKIAEISHAAIRLYLAEPALTTLHAVTSCQALADLTLDLVTNKEAAKTFVKLWSLYWIWLTGLYLEKGFPESLPDVDDRKSIGNDWDDIAQQARKIPEVHLIKMVYSCKWLFENIETNELYRIACLNIIAEKEAHPSVIRWTKEERLI